MIPAYLQKQVNKAGVHLSHWGATKVLEQYKKVVGVDMPESEIPRYIDLRKREGEFKGLVRPVKCFDEIGIDRVLGYKLLKKFSKELSDSGALKRFSTMTFINTESFKALLETLPKPLSKCLH